MHFDRKKYFDAVRKPIFGGGMTQGQVDGQEVLLSAREALEEAIDLRWFAYELATTFHETAATMQPIEEYGKGEGHEYGEPDPETGQCFYGRGFVQLTWADNYKRATENLQLTDDDDLYWHADRALDPVIAGNVMFWGMREGWFTGRKLGDYFNAMKDDPIGARQIINPDDKGSLIASYHASFLTALKVSAQSPEPAPSPEEIEIVITIDSPVPVKVTVV
jgi:putative chitinase